MSPDDPIWAQMIPSEILSDHFEGFQMRPGDPRWFHMVPDDPRWAQMISGDLRWSQGIRRFTRVLQDASPQMHLFNFFSQMLAHRCLIRCPLPYVFSQLPPPKWQKMFRVSRRGHRLTKRSSLGFAVAFDDGPYEADHFLKTEHEQTTNREHKKEKRAPTMQNCLLHVHSTSNDSVILLHWFVFAFLVDEWY